MTPGMAMTTTHYFMKKLHLCKPHHEQIVSVLVVVHGQLSKHSTQSCIVGTCTKHYKEINIKIWRRLATSCTKTLNSELSLTKLRLLPYVFLTFPCSKVASYSALLGNYSDGEKPRSLARKNPVWAPFFLLAKGTRRVLFVLLDNVVYRQL